MGSLFSPPHYTYRRDRQGRIHADKHIIYKVHKPSHQRSRSRRRYVEEGKRHSTNYSSRRHRDRQSEVFIIRSDRAEFKNNRHESHFPSDPFRPTSISQIQHVTRIHGEPWEPTTVTGQRASGRFISQMAESRMARAVRPTTQHNGYCIVAFQRQPRYT